MNIQKRIDGRKCINYKSFDGGLSCLKANIKGIEFCDNCKANHEDVQIQEMIHERIKKLEREIKEFIKEWDDGFVKGVMVENDTEQYYVIKELKQLCGCECGK